MRKVKYSVGVSLDGYIAGPDGSVDWLERATAKSKGEDFGMTAFFQSIDTVLMGRKTYETAVQMGASKTVYPNMRNIVFSRTLPSEERDGVSFVSDDPKSVIEALRSQEGKDIWLCGGGELARAALAENLVDEITLGITPVLIGQGRLTFPPGFPEIALELAECKQYKGGVVGLTYRVLNSSAASMPKKAKRSPR